MSDKRFIIVKAIENLYALVDKEREDTEQILLLSLHKEQLSDVADLLNELSTSCRQLEKEVKSLNAFLVSKDLAIEYLKWK